MAVTLLQLEERLKRTRVDALLALEKESIHTKKYMDRYNKVAEQYNKQLRTWGPMQFYLID